jgi:hypothetical protein
MYEHTDFNKHILNYIVIPYNFLCDNFNFTGSRGAQLVLIGIPTVSDLQNTVENPVEKQ